MKHHFVSAIAASLALAACGGTSEPAGEPSGAVESVTSEAPAAAAAAPGAGAAPTKDFMVGNWGDNGDCEFAIEFKGDGSMGGPFDKWEIDDKGVLTMVGNPQKMHLKVVDQDTLESRLDGTGAPRKVTRCK